MAKHKRQGGGSPRRRHRATGPTVDLPKDIPQLLRSLAGDIDQNTPPGKAQALMLQARAEPNPARQARLAHEALAAWPDCADAYLLLGEQASSLKEQIAVYQQAVAAGERALGPEAIKRHAGHLWGFLEARPYLEARQELAFGLWSAGRREEAV